MAKFACWKSAFSAHADSFYISLFCTWVRGVCVPRCLEIRLVNLIEKSAQSITITVFIISGVLCFLVLVLEIGLFHLHFDERLQRRRFRSDILRQSAKSLHAAPPAAGDSSEDARALTWRYCPHTANDGHSWYLSNSVSLFVGCCHGCCPVRATGGSLPCGLSCRRREGVVKFWSRIPISVTTARYVNILMKVLNKVEQRFVPIWTLIHHAFVPCINIF